MTAIDIYEMFCDMDFRDYIETIDHDIDYINSLIKQNGVEKTIALLADYFEYDFLLENCTP